MKRLLLLVIIVGEIAVLGWMAGEREWILRHGQTVLLRTGPVDPRDPMRGDYIRFNLEAANLPKALCRDGAIGLFTAPSRAAAASVQDRVVYVSLRAGEDGVAEVTAVSDQRPVTGLFLRGRVVSVGSGVLNVRYGVEAKFTQQGLAKAFEEQARQRVGDPVDLVVAVGGSGIAVLRDYRWEPLGITVEQERAPAQPRAGAARAGFARPVRGLEVELKNHSDRPVAIVVRPEGRSFRLVQNARSGRAPYAWVGEGSDVPPPEATMVRVLPPGGVYREHLDLTAPPWFVRDTTKPLQKPLPLPELEQWGMSFRVEYAPPPAADCVGLPNAALIRHAHLVSRAFIGGID